LGAAKRVLKTGYGMTNPFTDRIAHQLGRIVNFWLSHQIEAIRLNHVNADAKQFAGFPICLLLGSEHG